MFSEKITFQDGIIVGNQLFTEALLEEEVFNHTLRASSLPDIDVNRLDDQAYFSAALLAVRLQVPGLFAARMKHDPTFAEIVEEFAERTERKLKDVTASQVHPVAIEMVENLSRMDGRLLGTITSRLIQRRVEFRTQALAIPDGPALSTENGLPGGDNLGEESGRSAGDTKSV